MKKLLHASVIWMMLGFAMAEDAPPAPESLSGGACTVFNAGGESFGSSLANITMESHRKFVVGRSFFNENWVVAPASAASRDGLGPLFHARSCFECHVEDGRGNPPQTGEMMTSLLLRCSLPGAGENGGPKPDPTYGLQLAVRGIPGAKPEVEAQIVWSEVSGSFPDGERYSLRKPKIEILRWQYGKPSDELMVSARISQPVFGLGLLEAIPEIDILALAKEEGIISGRANMVWDSEMKRTRLGRFGWKANVTDLRQQTAAAFLGDIGIRSSVLPGGDFTEAQAGELGKFPSGGEPEISERLLSRVVSYLRGLAPPGRRDTDLPEVRKGESLFRKIDCAKCHVAQTFTTGPAELSELSGQLIRPYTDMLLHDMGEGLADARPDYLANGSEWRTPPLWGIGLNEEVNGNDFFLHDGRARNFTEAILWHGGESEESTKRFKALPKEDRAALLKFLRSL